MENYMAAKLPVIPPGYMTVGEVAKKMGVTVRTLQYYDKEGLLKPSSESEGGRRLYTHKDIIKLHQIQSMKYIGFSLEEIKTKLPSLDTPEEVASILLEQEKGIRGKIANLTDVLESIKKLSAEVLQMKTVDWVKYADIIILLQSNNDVYWAMKHINGKLLDHIRNFDMQKDHSLMEIQKRLDDKADELQKNVISPESEQGQAFAKDYWEMVMMFTKGDMSLIPDLIELASKHGDSKWINRREFIGEALISYFAKLGYNPFKIEEENV